MIQKAKPPQRRKTGYDRQDMVQLLERSGIMLSAQQAELLWSYHNLLRQYNPDLNLTRIHNFENMVLKLYADSILPGTLIRLPSPLMDLGSGPGMPGIPLKIAFPELDVILAESRSKRTDFLEKVSEQLGLENVSVVSKSITASFAEPVNGVITRAVEHMAPTLERISGCLSQKGLAIFMKGPACDPEITEALDTCGRDYRLLSDISYRIPHTPHERRLVVFERISAPVRQQSEAAAARHTHRIIESGDNAVFKQLKKLRSGRGIRKHQAALASGSKITAEILRNFPERCLAWISRENQPPGPDVPPHTAWYQLSAPLFQEIDEFGTNAPILMASIPDMIPWSPEAGFAPGCTLLVPFQDPENVGTVIRSAVAFGVTRIVLLAESAHPFHPKAVRASGGAVFHAKLHEGPSLSDLLPDHGIIALSADGADITSFSFPASFGLIPGMEGPGLPPHLRKNTVSIPISAAVESLNAAAAAAIALFVWSSSIRSAEAPAPGPGGDNDK
jgi:16S rRNA (guanine(527)-N(7))-methyltransferase RsmG